MKKRILSLLLTLAMLISLVPAMSLTAAATGPYVTINLAGGSYGGTAPEGWTEVKDSSEPETVTGYTKAVESGNTVTLPSADTLTKEGYTLVGWRASGETNTELLAPGAVVSVGETTVEYQAVWGYKVTLNPNGGTYATENVPSGYTKASEGDTYTKGVESSEVADFTLPDGPTTAPTEPEGSNYTFLGWKDNENGMNDAGTEITVTKDVTYTAVWGYKVTLNPNGGTYTDNKIDADGKWKYNGDEAKTYTQGFPKPEEGGHTFTLPDGPTAPTGKTVTFAGWRVSTAESTTEPTEAGREYTLTGDVTFNAVWNSTVTLDLNGGAYTTAPGADWTADSETSSAKYTYTAEVGTALTAPADPTKGDNGFAGWKTGDGNPGKLPNIMPDTNTTYTADWKSDIGVSFALGSGVWPNTTLSTYFGNWDDNENSDYTLTFKWDRTVTNSDYSMGAFKDTKSNVFSGEFMIPQLAPTQDGYSFVGWTVSSDTSKTYKGGEYVTVAANQSSNITLTAKWQKNKVLIWQCVRDGMTGDAGINAFFTTLPQYFTEKQCDVVKHTASTLDNTSLDDCTIVFIVLPNVDIANNSTDVTKLKNFLQNGGRIVMVGEHTGFAATEDQYLSMLATALGATFHIEPGSAVATYNFSFNENSSLYKTSLKISGENATKADIEKSYPQCVANIIYEGTCEWVGKDSTAAWCVDQAAGSGNVGDSNDSKGRITAISDVNWMQHNGTVADRDYKPLLDALLQNAADNRSTVFAGLNPNDSFAGKHTVAIVQSAEDVTEAGADHKFDYFAEAAFKVNGDLTPKYIKLVTFPDADEKVAVTGYEDVESKQVAKFATNQNDGITVNKDITIQDLAGGKFNVTDTNGSHFWYLQDGTLVLLQGKVVVPAGSKEATIKIREKVGTGNTDNDYVIHEIVIKPENGDTTANDVEIEVSIQGKPTITPSNGNDEIIIDDIAVKPIEKRTIDIPEKKEDGSTALKPFPKVNKIVLEGKMEVVVDVNPDSNTKEPTIGTPAYTPEKTGSEVNAPNKRYYSSDYTGSGDKVPVTAPTSSNLGTFVMDPATGDHYVVAEPTEAKWNKVPYGKGNLSTVTIEPGTSSGFPVTVTIAAAGDTVLIDPDGSGTTAAVMSYTTTTADTKLSVPATTAGTPPTCVPTLTKGGVYLDNGEGILVAKTTSDTVAISNTTGSGTATKIKVETQTNGAAPYTVTVPAQASVTIGNVEYTNPATDTDLVLSVASDGKVSIVSGTVALDKGTDGNGESIIVPTTKPYTVTNGTNSTEEKAAIQVTAKVNNTTMEVDGADILVPSGATFTVTPSGGGTPVSYTATGKLASKYVADSSGNVSLDGQVQTGSEGTENPGVQLVLTEGEVTLDPNETVYTDSGKVILNSNTGTENTITPVIVTSETGTGNIGDTNIPLSNGQKVTVGEKLKNGVVQTPKGEYESVTDGTIISVDNDGNTVYAPGTVKLTAGAVYLDAADTPIGVTGATAGYKIDVPEDKPTVTVKKASDTGACEIEIPTHGAVDITVGGTTYKYVNHSANPVTVPITAEGKIKTTLNENTAPSDLPGGSYEGYCQSVNGTTTSYIFEDDLDELLSKAYLDALSGEDTNKDNANKTVKNTIVVNTDKATNPTTNGYVLTQNCIDIYTAQGNLAKNGKHTDVTAYTEADAVDGVDNLYTVDSRERSQQYVSNQSIAGDITSCMVVKISNETDENGHVEVQAGEAKIKWNETDTTYYVTLTDALYDASHNIADGTGENQYNKHDGKGTAQTIIMNINPYGDRVGMTLEKGDKLTVRGEDVSKEGDSFTAITDATISMYTAKKNNVYLTAGEVRADNATAESETANGVKVYVNTDDTYYAYSAKPITVTGGMTTDADTFDELSTAAKVAATEANQTVTVGVGTKDSHADTVEFTSATETSAYPICRAGKLDNVNDKVTVKGENKADYTVYSLVNRGEEYTDAIDRYTKIVDLATSTGDGYNMTITNGSGVTSITTAGALSKVTVPKNSKLSVTVGANVYSYVNDSNGPVSMSLTGTGATMDTVLNESTAPTNLPKGTYDAYVIKTDGNTTTYTFQNGMDAIFAKAALENGEVHTVVINTDLETIPSTTTYIHTMDSYDIYGVEGKLTKSNRDDTKYTGIDGVKTVDARERVAFHALDDEYIASLAACMMVKVVNGKVYVEAGEARIRWSETDTTYYLTLADAIYDAAHNKADGTTSEVYNNNTHDGKGSVQTIIMNTNPYANRENMAMENGDVLMTCGENVYNAGDKYTAVKNAVITMFKSHNDVYLTAGLLQADANAIEGEDKTVTVYVNTANSGYYASSERRMFVTAGKTMEIVKYADIPFAARVMTTLPGQTVTVGVGGSDKVYFTAGLANTFYPICRAGALYIPGDKVTVKGSNTKDYTVYSLLRVFDKDHKPLEPKYEYAKISVPASNGGDTVIVNGAEQNKLGTVRVKSAAESDKFILWMPQEPLPVSYSVAENETTAVFSAPHTLTLASGGYHFIGDCTFKINGVDFKGKDAATDYTVAHRSGVDIVDICDEVYGVSAGKTVYVSYNEAKRTVKYGDKTYTSTNSSAAVMIPGKTANVDPAGGSDIYADYQDRTHRHFYVSGPVFSGHAIKIDEINNGTVGSNPRTAMAGTVVTLTVKADEGYKLKSLRVLDFNGNEVKLTDLGDGKYSFTMPGSSVTVKAEFIGEGEIIGFVDVPADAYYADAVAWAAENDITKGTDAVHFSPNAPVTRAQVVTFLWRAAGKPVVNYAMSFADVSGDAYYTEAVRWAVAEGITKGTSDTTFSPDKVCTRGQIVTFLARFAGVEDDASGYSHGFTDVKATDYYNNAVAWAKDNKVTEGTTPTTFSPNTDCTRAQVVTFLYRWMVK